MKMLAIILTLGVSVCVVESGLQISPATLLLPSPVRAQSRQETTSAIFTCVQVEEGSEPQRPGSQVVWLKDGVLIVTQNNKKYRHYRRKKWLQIHDVNYSDQGVYECMHFIGDTDRGRAELWISPAISNVPMLQTVTVGNEVMVKCVVKGRGYDVIWSLRGVIIVSTNGTRLNSRYQALSNGSLIIHSSHLGDSGCYTCTASNKAGNVSANIQLIATTHGRPTTVAVEASLCEPHHAVAMTHNNSTTPSGVCHQATETGVTSEGCDILEDVSFGEHQRSIETSPTPATREDELYSPVFLHTPQSCLQTTAGYTVDIVCVATGNPTPLVWWVKDNETITGPQAATRMAHTYHYYEQREDDSLRIHSLRERNGGVYQCIAENSEGRVIAMTTLRVWGVGEVCGCVRGGGGEGERVRRITEGSQVTSPEQYPWQALIEYRHLHSDRLCGGTLLRPDWLVTAAHCLHAGNHWLRVRDLIIRVGVVNRSTSEPTQQRLHVQSILPHPQYNISSQYLINKVPEYDIALVRLSTSARLTGAVQPACLPVVNSDPPVGTMCHVSGWGHLDYQQGPSPTVLHRTLVPLVNYSNCRHEDSYGTAVTRKHLCAGFDKGGPDACQNDSGGPLVCVRGGKWRLYGVVNHGTGCGHERKYGLYARVVRYNNWLKAVLNT